MRFLVSLRLAITIVCLVWFVSDVSHYYYHWSHIGWTGLLSLFLMACAIKCFCRVIILIGISIQSFWLVMTIEILRRPLIYVAMLSLLNLWTYGEIL